MAGSSLFTLIDDIAALLDDVAAMSKVAATKTAGVLGDDLALNAQQVSGVSADRELPVVWAVAKGSLLNKMILVPLALAISWLAPWAIIPLLMIGGAFLCYEGFEKLVHKFLHSTREVVAEHEAHLQALANPAVDLCEFERDKIKGAIRTDFILSAEIIVITLGSVAAVSLLQQLAVLTTISLLMTVGVYGLVASIVKMDDVGLYLSQLKSNNAALQRSLGHVLLRTAPLLMKFLSIAGTVAMFLVGGGIITHSLPFAHHLIEHVTELAGGVASVGGLLHFIVPGLFNLVVGLLTGALVLLCVLGGSRLLRMVKKPA